MIRRVLLSAVSGVALASSAFAADIYSPGPVNYAAVAMPVSSWSGFYLGINGGYGGESGLGFRDNVFETSPVTPYASLAGSTNITGGFGGGQVGYNLQAGNIVYGIETDIQGSGIMGSGTQAFLGASGTSFCPASPFLPASCGAKSDLNVDYFGTVRGRLGYNVGGTLLYLTGGFAYGGVNTSTAYADYITPGSVNLHGRASNSATLTGWTAGAGVEYKISPSWSLKGEYQFVDLGSISAGPGPTLIGTTPSVNYLLNSKSQQVEFNTVRVGLNYFFNAAYEPLPLK
jgi:outer membrane immunogenic protein